MSKAFLVKRGFEVRYRHVWYGEGVRVIIDEGDHIEVFATGSDGRPDLQLGRHGYENLNPIAPPRGLRIDSTLDLSAIA
ncbi:MAG TPA: hypothetical protein VJR58_26910 [Vineibacter sp.]|nr:hypothetical protein [Vineibacter sp.]